MSKAILLTSLPLSSSMTMPVFIPVPQRRHVLEILPPQLFNHIHCLVETAKLCTYSFGVDKLCLTAGTHELAAAPLSKPSLSTDASKVQSANEHAHECDHETHRTQTGMLPLFLPHPQPDNSHKPNVSPAPHKPAPSTDCAGRV